MQYWNLLGAEVDDWHGFTVADDMSTQTVSHKDVGGNANAGNIRHRYARWRLGKQP
jgi:hypothetical protein